MSDKKISYISFMQFIGPIFVVLGHSLNGLDTKGFWYIFSKEWIYIFHMPLFFLISGYLLSYKDFLGNKSYGSFVIGKIKRLLLPYFVWNLLFLVPKLLAAAYITDAAPESPLDAILAFVFPRQNVWGHTWFLMGLFLVYLLAPIFKLLLTSKNHIIPFITLIACIVLYMLPINTELFALSDLHKDLLFFVIGCLLGRLPRKRFIAMFKNLRYVFLIQAVVFSIPALIFFEKTEIFRFIPCFFILMSLLCAGVATEKMPRIIEKLAADSFSIYILHWPVMLSVRILLQRAIHANDIVIVIVTSILGWIIPVVIIELIRRMPWNAVKKPLKYLLGV